MYGLGKQMTGRNNNQTDEGGKTGTEKGECACYSENKFRNLSIHPPSIHPPSIHPSIQVDFVSA